MLYAKVINPLLYGTAMQPADLRIVTYNIHKGFSAGNRRFILPKLRDALIEIDADIVMLQEVQGEHTGLARREPEWPHINHADFFSQRSLATSCVC